jgi:hypothetical protein
LRRTRTAAELILPIYSVMLVAVWAVVVLGAVGSVIEIGGRREGAWLVGAVILALAGLAGIGFLLRALSSWRRALARPIPDHGLKGWLWRQPGWRLALIIWAFQLTAVGLVVAGFARFTHGGLAAFTHSRAPQFLAVSLAVVVIGMAVTAVGQAAEWCVIRQRQTEASSAASPG